MIRQVLKVFKALISNEKPWQLSLGLAFGGIIGLMPLWTPHNIVLLFLAFIINLNFALLAVPKLGKGFDKLFQSRGT